MKRILVVILSLGLCACGHAHKSAAAAKKHSTPEKASAPHGAATITADPNPVPASGELGDTTLTWDTGDDETGEVYVTKNGGPEKLFASSSSGSQKVPWISAKTRFQFLLYEGTDHKKLLAKVQVAQQGKSAPKSKP